MHNHNTVRLILHYPLYLGCTCILAKAKVKREGKRSSNLVTCLWSSDHMVTYLPDRAPAAPAELHIAKHLHMTDKLTNVLT